MRKEAEAQRSHRQLSSVGVYHFTDPKSVTTRSDSWTNEKPVDKKGKQDPIEKKKQAKKPKKQAKKTAVQSNEHQPTIKNYSLENALSVFDVYDRAIALFLYDPTEDQFLALYSDNISWEESRFVRIRDAIFNSLRILFPDRFTSESPEFAMAVASMDYPQVKYSENDCFMNRDSNPCVPEDFPPILQFGSVFQLPKIPSTIAMPMPEKNHLGCFHHWLQHHEVCELYQPKRPGNPLGLVFGENVGLKWDDLINQVVWRATDRGFLSRMIPDLRRPDFEEDILPKLNQDENVNVTATKAIREVYNELVPRWKGVVWTAEAEREAEQENGPHSLPWANIKYATTFYMKGVDDSEYYNQFMEHGIPAIGEKMDLETLAKYRYHMDIGGGGGESSSFCH